MPATVIHDISTASIVLHNTTEDPQTFEFSVPQGSDLTLSPHVDTIPGGGTLRVMLRYCPQPNTGPAVPDASRPQSAAGSAAAAEGAPEGTANAAADKQRDEEVCAVTVCTLLS